MRGTILSEESSKEVWTPSIVLTSLTLFFHRRRQLMRAILARIQRIWTLSLDLDQEIKNLRKGPAKQTVSTPTLKGGGCPLPAGVCTFPLFSGRLLGVLLELISKFGGVFISEGSLVNKESFCSKSLELQGVLSARGCPPTRADVVQGAADLGVDEMPRG
ncbi:UNVERIFIED_CONTAM: hypothetical protein Slati_2977000 [Sesamum latifolium]|uniref:Uncharacterized protein n=1 Tax=Sesamum latifolium TaxID=2727402 RepID=A0AAW2VEZ1_9LAMI